MLTVHDCKQRFGWKHPPPGAIELLSRAAPAARTVDSEREQFNRLRDRVRAEAARAAEKYDAMQRRDPDHRIAAAVHECGHGVAAHMLFPPGSVQRLELPPAGAFGLIYCQSPNGPGFLQHRLTYLAAGSVAEDLHLAQRAAIGAAPYIPAGLWGDLRDAGRLLDTNLAPDNQVWVAACRRAEVIIRNNWRPLCAAAEALATCGELSGTDFQWFLDHVA